MWIVKPASKSRGRGISVCNKFDSVINYIKENKGARWVVQKYIEKPLLIENKKFDIRQWVLVTDWNPLTVWAYKDSYVRLASQEYNEKKLDKYSHLTNTAIVKEHVKKEYGDELDSDEEEGDEYDLDNILSV